MAEQFLQNFKDRVIRILELEPAFDDKYITDDEVIEAIIMLKLRLLEAQKSVVAPTPAPTYTPPWPQIKTTPYPYTTTTSTGSNININDMYTNGTISKSDVQALTGFVKWDPSIGDIVPDDDLNTKFEQYIDQMTDAMKKAQEDGRKLS